MMKHECQTMTDVKWNFGIVNSFAHRDRAESGWGTLRRTQQCDGQS